MISYGNMFDRPRREMEELEEPKPVSIDWSSFERPGPASQKYRQLLDSAPQRPEIPKGDAIAAGLIGFARDFTGKGEGTKTYDDLVNRPYHKMMEDWDRNAKVAHEAAALENQDRDDMAKVLMGRERANDRELGRYYEKKRLAAQIRGQDLENARGLARIRNDQADDAADNARADRELDFRGREVAVNEGNLKTRREELDRDKANDLLDFGAKTIKSISDSLPKPKSDDNEISPSQQKSAHELALIRLAEEHPDYYEDDGEGGKRIRKDITENGRMNLRAWKRQIQKEIEDKAKGSY